MVPQPALVYRKSNTGNQEKKVIKLMESIEEEKIEDQNQEVLSYDSDPYFKLAPDSSRNMLRHKHETS